MIADPRLPRSGGGFLPAGNVPVSVKRPAGTFSQMKKVLFVFYLFVLCIYLFVAHCSCANSGGLVAPRKRFNEERPHP